MTIRSRCLPMIALVVLLVLVPIQAAQTQSSQAVDPAPSRSPSGERVLRSWRDTVKIHGRDQARNVEMVYDYDAGVALRRTYDADGELLFERILGAQPQPSQEEVAEAFAKVNNDAALGALSRMVDAQLDGGFILEEAAGEPCDRGARCIQVFMLSQSRWGFVRHSVVDMRRARIAHRSFRSGRSDPR